MGLMNKYVFAILAVTVYSPTSFAALGDYLKDTYVGISLAQVNYEMKASTGARGVKATANAKRLLLGRRINDWASMEFQFLYDSSVDSFDNSRQVLGRDFSMEVNRFYSLDFRGIAYQYEKYDVHGVVGLTRLKYLDQDGAVAQGRGFNYGIGVGARFSRRFYLKFGWEMLPRVDYDENLFGAPLDPMHIDASQLKLQFDIGIK